MDIHRKIIELKNKKREFMDNRKYREMNSKDKEVIKSYNKQIKFYKGELYSDFKKNTSVRSLNPEYLTKYKIISVFESDLTRTLGIGQNELSEDLIIVQTYFFDVLKDIVVNGFTLNDQRYVCFTASAGQIRTKKTVFIKEDVIKKYEDTLMCGLTVDKINSMGGVNVNKFLAYLALCNSATDLWKDFDIRKSIVVEDMETIVSGEVDFIDDKTYEIKRQVMDIPINHTDGCGMILPKVSRKNFMVRLPWIKGLLVSFPFNKFAKECGNSKVKDIYGKEHDVIKEDIQVIFTKSQVKMWKFYSSWDDYIDNYIRFNCSTGKCNVEEDYFGNAKLNYQMLQTLTDITDDELKYLSTKSVQRIKNLSTDRDTMLKVFGVVKSNTNKTYLQQALEIYPELLSDTYTREILKQIKKSLVKESKSAKLDINGKYTFIAPDLYAFCEYLFKSNPSPTGLLKDGEVFCRLYKDSPKLDCLRSPHLYREHAVRRNIIDDEKRKWFTTNALYTSCHDLISKTLQFDTDGDKALVCADKTFIEIAERNMKDVVPIYYVMKKSDPVIVDNNKIYEGLVAAYTGGNIGQISNDITKVWNGFDINLDVIKLLCLQNNFVIDYAKTLYKPTRPDEINCLISKYTKNKVPHFFIYAKDKKPSQVEPINHSCVNRLDKLIPNPKLNFQCSNYGSFNYRNLMKNPSIEIDNQIISAYNELNTKNHFLMSRKDNENHNYDLLYREIREKILELNPDIYYVVDVLVRYLYFVRKSKYKETLWLSFGDIILENLKTNIKENTILCQKCGKRVNKETNNQLYCERCSAYIPIETKTIICVDCGSKVVIENKNTKAIRCNSCYKKYRNNYQKELMRSLRSKN